MQAKSYVSQIFVIVMFCLSWSLSGCGAGTQHGSTSGQLNSSSSGFTASGSSSTSSSSSSSTTSSSSSSSSSSGSPTGPSFSLFVNEFCESSVGENFGNYFQLADTQDARIDFPQVSMNLGPVYRSSTDLTFNNSSENDIKMAVWTNGKLTSQEIIFPPTVGWHTIPLGSAGANFQVSLTAKEKAGGLAFQGLNYHWNVDCSISCGYSQPSPTNCPSQPLPGVPVSTPVAPVARLSYGGPASGDVPFKLNFSAAGSYDENLEKLSYHWDFDDGSESLEQEPEHIFTKIGIHIVRLTVTDPTGLTATDVKTISVGMSIPGNNEPTAKISSARTNVLTPHTLIELSALESTDPDGDELDYVWTDLQTGEATRGPQLTIDLESRTYSLLQLEVSDGRGGIAFDYKNLSAMPPPETDCIVNYRDSFPLFAMEVSLFNRNATPVNDWQVGWTFDEAVDVISVSGAILASSDPLRVQGMVGEESLPPYSWTTFSVFAKSDMPIQDIAVSPSGELECEERKPPTRNHEPVAVMSTSTAAGASPLEVTFSAEGSYDPDGDAIIRYFWDFGDGTSAEGPEVVHTYRGVGKYSPRLLVSDAESTGHFQSFNGVEALGSSHPTCQPTFQYSNHSSGEYTAKIWIINNTEEAVYVSNGLLTFNKAVAISTAEESSNISVTEATSEVPFSVETIIEPSQSNTIEFSGTLSNFDEVYFTDCELF